MQVVDVLIKPIISEKAVQLANHGQYAFLVQPAASKQEIKKAVEQYYNVEVTGVKTAQHSASPRRQTKKRIENPGLLRKKAYITLKEGQTLNILEGEE